MAVQIQDGPLLPAATDVRVFGTTEEWRVGRNRLGGSEGAAILGLSPDRTSWSVYAHRVLGQNRITTAEKKLFARGHREEQRILIDYAETFDARVMMLKNVIVDGPDPVSVSPDGFIEDDELGAWGNGEAKTDLSPFWWGKAGAVIESWTPEAATIVREDYAVQGYIEMLGTGLPFTRLIVRRTLDDMRPYTLLRDEKLIARMHSRLSEWWDKHIVNRIPPNVDGSDACRRALARMFGAGKLRSKQRRRATPEEIAIALEAEAASVAEEQAKARKELLRAQLAKSIGNVYGIEWEGPKGRSSVSYYDVAERMDLDEDLLRLKFPEAFRACLVKRPANRIVKLNIKT